MMSRQQRRRPSYVLAVKSPCPLTFLSVRRFSLSIACVCLPWQIGLLADALASCDLRALPSPPPLLAICYKGQRAAFDALLDAYERRLSGGAFSPSQLRALLESMET